MRSEPGWAGLGRAGLGWAGLGWAGLGWEGLGWAGYTTLGVVTLALTTPLGGSDQATATHTNTNCKLLQLNSYSEAPGGALPDVEASCHP